MSAFAVILAAAGQSRRFQKNSMSFLGSFSQKKPFVKLCGRSVWLHSLDRFSRRSEVRQILLVVPPEERKEIEQAFSMEISFHSIELVDGGKERWQSIQNALERVRDEIDYVAIHDAARPCVSDQAIASVFESAQKFGAAILAVPVTGTLKKSKVTQTDASAVERLQQSLTAEGGSKIGLNEVPVIQTTVSRENLWEAQTPQVFQKDLLKEAYRLAESLCPTDDAQLLEQTGTPVALVPSDRRNLKITSSTDLSLAEAILSMRREKKTFNPFKN